MALKIYNTLTAKKDDFIPIAEGKAGMYVCGVTVYDHCHIGHARAAVVFDVIFRYLKFRGYEVTYVRNFTDIDDKIIKKAKEEGVSWKEIADRYIKEFYNDMESLGITRPTFEPRAVDYIPHMIKVIEGLISKGAAYESNGDVYYSVKGFKNYGKLSKKDIADLIAGERVEPGEDKRDPIDFALWKGSKEGEPSWDSPWGKGRPGWHIECSAMANHYLGKKFDIHGGGMDLIFPHHENEIAQSEAAFGTNPANFWIHNGFVNINNEKMSKSLKNFFTIKDVLNSYRPEVVRLFLLSAHYRSPLEFSDENLSEMTEKLDRFYEMQKKVNNLCDSIDMRDSTNNKNFSDTCETIDNMIEDFSEAMDDDFNTALAIGNLFSAIRDVNRLISKSDTAISANDIFILKRFKKNISQIGGILGLFMADPEEYFHYHRDDALITAAEIEELIAKREEARRGKDWKEADRVRDELYNKGIILQDVKGKTEWKRI